MQAKIILNPTVKIQGENLKLFTSKREGDACFDVFANIPEGESILIPPLESRLIPTGIKTQFEPGYVFRLGERGSTGAKNMKVNAGFIDSNFRGEWFVCIYNGNDCRDLIISNEEKWRRDEYEEDNAIVHPIRKAIAQAWFSIALSPNFEDVNTLSSSDREAKQLGSTDK